MTDARSAAQDSPLRRVAREAPMLDETTERELVRRMREGSGAALDRLLRSHLRLVPAIAKRYERHGVSWEELLSEGNLALVEAARHFDPERGVRFATCASFWIRAYLQRFTVANRRIVAPPSTRNARRILGQLRRTERDLHQKYGEPPTIERLAEALAVTPDEVRQMQSALGAMDVPLGARHGAMELPDSAPTPEERTLEEECIAVTRRQVRSALARLDVREREIIRRRHLSERTATLRAVAKGVGLSRERVRQLDARAQQKIREAVQLDLVA